MFANYYTVVQPIVSCTMNTLIPPSIVASLSRESHDKDIKEDNCWHESVGKILAPASDDEENSVDQSVDMSWATYHASIQPLGINLICPSALLSLFHVSLHTVTMVKHSMDVVRKAVQHFDAGQTPVENPYQPLYATANQIHWKMPYMYGEDKFVVMIGGMHIEMAALRCLDGWLQRWLG